MGEATARRDVNLDLAKLLACLAVIGLHTLRIYSTKLTEALYLACGFAVPMFLVCSGYTLLRRQSVTPRYVLGKLGRVARVVVCWHLLALAAGIASGLLEGRGLSLAGLGTLPRDIFRSLLQRGDFWHFWYLGMLLVLYALLPELLWLVHSAGSARQKAWVWALSAAVCAALQIASEFFLHRPIQRDAIQTFRLWSWVQYLLMGHLLWATESRWRRPGRTSMALHTAALAACTAVAVYFQYFSGRNLIHNTYAEYFYDSPLVMAWVALLFTWVMRLPLGEVARKAVGWLAPLTMGMYIVHPLLLKRLTDWWKPGSVPGDIALFAGLAVASALVAFVLSKIPGVKKLIQL